MLATGLAYTISYFTAIANKNGELEFADLEVNLLSNGATLTDAKFQSEYLYNLTPGDTVDFATITVKNTGETDVYCLVKLDLEITKTDSSKINISRWYNLDAKVVNSTNLPANTVPASHIAMNSSDTIDLTYTFNGNSYDNSYKGATVKVTLGAYAVQYANIPTDDTYTTQDLYATYLIIDTYGGDNIQLMSLTLNIDGTPTTYQAEEGSTLLETASANNMADIEYTTCGFYTDASLMNGVDAESYMITEDVTLYSKTATTSSLTFRVNSTTSTTATTMATTMASTYTVNATFSVSAASTDISGDIVIPKRYTDGTNDGYVTAIDDYMDLDTMTETGYTSFSPISNAFTVTLPSTILDLGVGAFAYSGLTKINLHEDITKIPLIAFTNSAITSIYIPSGVTSLETFDAGGELLSTFMACTALTTVTFAEDSQLTSIGVGTFASCQSLSSITLPSGVTHIGGGAFAASGITSINIPAGVTSLEPIVAGDQIMGTFMVCVNLTTVTFDEGSRLESIGQNAFALTAITQIDIPNGVISIGQAAFSLTKLETLTIPSSVTEIKEEAFSYCEYLIEVTIPRNVRTIGEKAFGYCNRLETVYLPSTIESFASAPFENDYGFNEITFYTDVANAATATAKWGTDWDTYALDVVYNTSLEEYKAIINS